MPVCARATAKRTCLLGYVDQPEDQFRSEKNGKPVVTCLTCRKLNQEYKRVGRKGTANGNSKPLPSSVPTPQLFETEEDPKKHYNLYCEWLRELCNERG